MPNLYLDALPSHISRSTVSRLLIQVGGIDKRLIGAIRVDGRRAAVEVPDKWSHRLAAALDGANLAGRHIRCWCETSFSEGDGESHFQRLCRLLSLEAEEEMRRAMAAASGDLAAAEQSGNTIGNLHIRERSGGLGGRLLITLSKDAPQLLPWTRLGVGAPILLTSQNDQRDGFRGVVSWKTQREIQVAFSQPPSDEQSAGPLRIDISPDEISHRRQRRALERAEQASGDRLSELRRALLGSRPPESVDGDAPQIAGNSLNQSQRRAIVSALQASDFAMIHGPPGTGKTTTVAHFINAAAARGETVLACAPSNLAVDNLFERVLALGDRAIRIGHPARVLPQLRDNTLDLMVQSHPDMQIVKKLTRDAHALLDRADRYTRSKPPPGAKREMRIEARQMLNDARRLESQVVHAILDEAQVICATLTSLDSDILGQRRFDWAVIDEACQSTEPACWIPLLRCDRLLLAGDHCQLPPTVISRDAQQQGFGVSLFERLMNAPGQQVSHVLQVQYRMHESIMEFSSSWFYDEQLTAAESVARHLLSELPDVEKNQWTESPLHFIDTAGGGLDEQQEPDGESRLNPGEAELAVWVVHQLLDAGVRAQQIGVIAPYAAQVRLLRERLDIEQLEVDSVDGFQGREKEAIVVCTVRSNTAGEIGFLGDTRRINVALTRARRKLIVIGDSATIGGRPFYQKMLEHFERRDSYHTVWEYGLE